MPSEFLHIPPLYTLVGLYRLSTDTSIRSPVLDKIKHATIRGLVVSAIYAVGSWGVLRWVVKNLVIGGPGGFFGFGGARGKVAGAVSESRGGEVWVGLGRFGVGVDLILCEYCCKGGAGLCGIYSCLLADVEIPTSSFSCRRYPKYSDSSSTKTSA